MPILASASSHQVSKNALIITTVFLTIDVFTFLKKKAMQESWEFEFVQPLDLPNHVYSDMIKDLVELKAQEIAILLSYYYKSEGGLVEGVKLVGDINFNTQTSGTLTVNFRLVFFNACLDIHSINKDQMVLNFDLDPMTQKIKFSGPLWVEREPDEL